MCRYHVSNQFTIIIKYASNNNILSCFASTNHSFYVFPAHSHTFIHNFGLQRITKLHNKDCGASVGVGYEL